MTENKRFMLDDAGELIDLNNHKFIDYGDECCKLLNELAEENKDNKAMIEFLNIENNQIMNELKTRTQIQHQLEEEIKKLEKENNELKERNQELTRQLSAIKIEKINEIIEQNKKLKKQINELMK